jgi:phosphatidylglycerol:prolipoprotein diacylglycerol transferase
MTVYPLILRLGPIELTGYGLMMMVAFLMAGWAIQLDLRRRGLDEEYAADIVIAGVIGGLVGAKIWYVLLTGDWGALLRRGGFVWYGGFLGATSAILFNSWRRVVPARFTADLCAAPLALGYALGRVGCFLVNDDYGMPSNLPWAMQFPKGLPETTAGNLARMGAVFPPGTSQLQLVAVHPTQLYETILMFLAFWWLWRHRDHGRGAGWLFGWYLVFAGAERFLIEFVRAKDDRLLGPFTLAQATSVLLVLVGAYLLQRWREPSGVSAQPASLVPKPAPPPRAS